MFVCAGRGFPLLNFIVWPQAAHALYLIKIKEQLCLKKPLQLLHLRLLKP
jgi:hypothetical protein